MDEVDEFILVLPSNSSMKFHENTTSCFTTHLQREIVLRGRWSVGLSEIHLPLTIMHIRKEEASFLFVQDVEQPSEARFDHGVYDNVSDLADAINRCTGVQDHQKIIVPQYPSGFYKIRRVCSCAGSHYTYFSEKLCNVFGFSEMSDGGRVRETVIRTDSSNRIVEANIPACMDRALPNQIYIYTDICEPYTVGDTRAALLRITCLDTTNYRFGNTQVVKFAPINYIPLLSHRFQDITIDMRDQFGAHIPFEYGTSTVTLHFKRII